MFLLLFAFTNIIIYIIIIIYVNFTVTLPLYLLCSNTCMNYFICVKYIICLFAVCLTNAM